MSLFNVLVETLEGLWFCRMMSLLWFLFALRYFREAHPMFALLCLTVCGNHLRELGLMKKILKK